MVKLMPIEEKSKDLIGVKMWVVWHRIYEEVLSVHLTEKGAQDRMTDLENKESSGRFEYDEFEIEL